MHWYYFVPAAVIGIGGLAVLRYREAKRFLSNINGED